MAKKLQKKKTPSKKAKFSLLSSKKKRKILGKSKKSVPAKQDIFEGVHRTKIRVIGVGGGGGNIVAEISSRVQKLDCIGANTDIQTLQELPKKIKPFSFGQDLTRGLGCGMDADLGERAAREEKERIKKLFEGQDVCILVASLGGGSGSGAAPVFAEISQEFHNLTFGIFTLPFLFEGDKRRQIAEVALEKLKPLVNAYVVIPNERIFEAIDKKTPFKEAFSAVNKRLADTLEGFIDTLFSPGLINIDFADVRALLEGRSRLAYINSARASGPARAQEVVRATLINPLYDYGIRGVDRMLFNIAGDKDLKMHEASEISRAITEYNPKAKIIFGISCNPKFKDQIRVTLFSVGCVRENQKKKEIPMQKDFKSVSGISKEQFRKDQKGTKKFALKRKQKKTPEEHSILPEGSSEEQVSQGGSILVSPNDFLEPSRVRRNALQVRKAVEEEIQELEKKEKQWDVPAFLRNKHTP